MLALMEDKKVVVKRYSSKLGEYNRPKNILVTVGTYPCHIAVTSSNTSQKQPQKENITDLTLYIDPDVVIKDGDILYIYDIDEYENIIPETEIKALADKPYKKRTILAVPLVATEEI